MDDLLAPDITKGLDITLGQVPFVGQVQNNTDAENFPYGFYVDSSSIKPINSGLISSYPVTNFPFTRLAQAVNGSYIHLYHQLDSITLAEETLDTSSGLWNSSTFTIET